MRKIAVVLLLILTITVSAYAVNIFDRPLYKKVVLTCINRYALVTRLTGQVSYIMGANGKWVPVSKSLRNQYQSMYNAQIASE